MMATLGSSRPLCRARAAWRVGQVPNPRQLPVVPLTSILILLSMTAIMGCSTATGPSAESVQWSRASAGLPPGSQAYPCLTSTGTTLLAGTNGAGVFRSTDGGVTWTAATTQPTNPQITSLTASGTT